MNKIYSSVIVMALVSLVACNKEGVQTVGETLSANAYISSGTKTVYATDTDEKGNPIVKVTWSDEDSFKAYYEGSKNPINFSKKAAGSSFSATDVPAGVTASTTFTGLYGSAATLNSDGKIDIDFSKQNGELKNLAAYDVMTATSTLDEGMLSFAFKHNCAILRLKCVNYTINPVGKVKLYFWKAQVSEEFGSTGLNKKINSPNYSLSINLKTLSDKGSSLKGQGSVTYRYVIVPAMSYLEPAPGIESMPIVDELDAFLKQIDFSNKKFIEAGKVYDVLCECGVEADEDGWIWGD